MRQQKIRVIVKEPTRLTLGVTIPGEFSEWKGVLVTITQSGSCLILTSGASPTPFTNKQLKQEGDVVSKIRI